MDNLNLQEKNMPALRQLKVRADNAYFNSGNPIMTDEAYDALCHFLETSSIGCLPPSSSDKIRLPVNMGSLTKHNDNKSINNFLNKFEHKLFVVQEKLDGVSCLLLVGASYGVRLYTRGDGSIGTDITHLLSRGLKLPLVKEETILIRGELIMARRVFESKYSSAFKNIRNMVSGQVSKKDPSADIMADVEFVAYEVIEPRATVQRPLVEQYQLLADLNFKVVYNRVIHRDFIQQEALMDYLNRRKRKSEYQIDGLVVTINGEYVRNECDNPKYSFAFKIQGETAKVEVVNIEWNLSKSGKYKPKILIRPVSLSGVTISSLTGFNARYVVDNKIGRGSKLLITRSGDVIPHIVAVLEPGDDNVVLPEQSRWKSVDLYHTFKEQPREVTVKQMVYFFTSLNCLNCKDKTILKIYNAGYKTIESIIEARVEDLSKIEGIGVKLAAKMLGSVRDNIKGASLHQLLAALNSFGEGIGLRKIQNINLSNPQMQIKGLSEATIREKILPMWEVSLNRVKDIKRMVAGAETAVEEEEEMVSEEGVLKGKTFVFTGFRDAALERQIANLGGRVASAVSKKTTDLVVSESAKKTSSKLLKAQKLGINISVKKDLMILVRNLERQQTKVDCTLVHYISSDEE